MTTVTAVHDCRTDTVVPDTVMPDPEIQIWPEMQ